MVILKVAQCHIFLKKYDKKQEIAQRQKYLQKQLVVQKVWLTRCWICLGVVFQSHSLLNDYKYKKKSFQSLIFFHATSMLSNFGHLGSKMAKYSII